jgi:site-specific recombinase XerD
MGKITSFEQFLRRENYAENTIIAYKYTVREFRERYKVLSRENLLLYKAYLIDNFKPCTANQRIRAINKYVAFVGNPELKIRGIKLPRVSFLDNVISNEDYLYFKKKLRERSDLRWYFAVWFMAATGVRVSELLQIRVEHVRAGFMDVYAKGGKMRRIFFPRRLREEAVPWLAEREGGPVFLNVNGQTITARGLSKYLKVYAEEYGLNPGVVYPHSFRHLFAKNFLKKSNDIVLLADLLGHETIETTRIYLQRSSREQGNLISRLVDW